MNLWTSYLLISYDIGMGFRAHIQFAMYTWVVVKL